MNIGVSLEDALRSHSSRRDKRRLELADALTTEYPLLLKRAQVPPDTCILAVRIGVEVAQQLGYRTRILPVRCSAHNALAVALRDAGVRPNDPEAREATGAFEVVLGFKDERKVDPDYYNGHLIFVLDDKLAVDLTAHQLAHPKRGLPIEPLYFPVTRDFIRGDEALGLTHPEEGWRVVYGPRPQDRTWASATDFDAKEYAAMHQQTAHIVQLLKEKYGVKPATRGRK